MISSRARKTPAVELSLVKKRTRGFGDQSGGVRITGGIGLRGASEYIKRCRELSGPRLATQTQLGKSPRRSASQGLDDMCAGRPQ